MTKTIPLTVEDVASLFFGFLILIVIYLWLVIPPPTPAMPIGMIVGFGLAVFALQSSTHRWFKLKE